MPIGPRPSDVPAIRRTVRVYKVSSIITGTFLLLLGILTALRWGWGVDVELGGPFGAIALTQHGAVTAFNLTTLILIMHGWFYVLYIGTDFVLWRLTRFSFGRFLFIALGGIIPLLSFFLEARVPRQVEAIISRIPQADAAPVDVKAEA